jgi:hypothetical protein
MFEKIKRFMQHVFLIALILWVISLVAPTALFFKVWTGALLLIIYVVFFSGAKWTGGRPKTFSNMGPGPLHTAYLLDDSDDEMMVPYDM